MEDGFNIEETLSVANYFNSDRIENTPAEFDTQVKSTNISETNDENKTLGINTPPTLIVKIAEKSFMRPANIPPPPPLKLMAQRPNIPNIEMPANIQPSTTLASNEKRDFSELSEAIWVHICSYLKVDDILVIRRISKKIKVFANMVLKQQRKQITIASNVVEEKMQFMLSVFSSIKELFILSSEIPFVNIIMCCKRNIPNLESLCVTMPTEDIDVTIIGHLLPNLKALNINCANTNDSEMLFVLSKLQNLQKLEIINTKITGQCFAFISNIVTTMLWKIGENVEVDNNVQFHHLSLNHFTFISNFKLENDRIMIDAISKQMPNLNFLSLSFFGLSLKDLSEIHGKPIKELRLKAKCILEYQRNLGYSIQDEFTNVRIVSLDLSSVSGKNLSIFLKYFSAIEQLTLVVRSNNHLAFVVVKELIKMKTLDKLILDLKNVKEVLNFENGANILLNRIQSLSNIRHIQLNVHYESNIHDFEDFDNLDSFLKLFVKIINQRQNQTFSLKLPLPYAEKL
ncbi:hypothetical protein B4U80_12004 [Leptotrombidium deliense]|uniref:Uncharacterized protein n=1 Tax=Leptotrombidium deliense TaxID=299467 RepID=A0A443S010_9ACAR|nr:hypothetical protein B4U80_12004 [Leptotrombidium deliense]